MSGWTWSYEDTGGAQLSAPQLVTTAFPTQNDAESWLGEHWRTLADEGVAAVTLHEDDTVVYGPMPLSDGS
ncbi:hypothetical protein [Flexivirga meconopsidis]|uniref:hypothetical protein n=1 Tax=Flexivirga meconopsidis TaxID=2977121 RepID=UPI00223E9085|nr:hypothetical protein [Flexivirga meconopsidis]